MKIYENENQIKLSDWFKLVEEETISQAMEENKVYNIDRFFWNGGKLFGHDIYYNPADDRIPCFDVIKNDHHYVFSILWNWEKYHLVLCCFTIVRGVPYRARTQIGYDILFSLKCGLVKTMMNVEIEKLINTIEKLIDNDKKDNRNS